MGKAIDMLGAGVLDVPAEVLAELFISNPGVGFAIVDRDGLLRFVNDRAAAIFLDGSAAEAVGRNVRTLFEAEWVAERMAVFDRMIERRRPVLYRHICRGRRVQSTVRLLPNLDRGVATIAVVTVEGEHDPPDLASYDVHESRIADLGPLSALTRRELEVLALVGVGLPSAVIAETLHRSPRTVEKHLDGLRSKLGAPNRVQLAEFARAARLRPSDALLRRSPRVASAEIGHQPDPAQRE